MLSNYQIEVFVLADLQWKYMADLKLISTSSLFQDLLIQWVVVRSRTKRLLQFLLDAVPVTMAVWSNILWQFCAPTTLSLVRFLHFYKFLYILINVSTNLCVMIFFFKVEFLELPNRLKNKKKYSTFQIISKDVNATSYGKLLHLIITKATSSKN